MTETQTQEQPPYKFEVGERTSRQGKEIQGHLRSQTIQCRSRLFHRKHTTPHRDSDPVSRKWGFAYHSQET